MQAGDLLGVDDLILMPPCLGDDTFEIGKNIGKKLAFKKRLDPALKKDLKMDYCDLKKYIKQCLFNKKR